ncbi:unnamed protein product [Phytomonas sp. EM1]|nr:unnamed protein product [Phytomonas sp. EM1]|eukprot:CCW65778.1 unnamed protein product [Phytomonas sp. isolate EM1]
MPRKPRLKRRLGPGISLPPLRSPSKEPPETPRTIHIEEVEQKRLQCASKFLDLQWRLPFVAKGKAEGRELINRLMVRMRLERTTEVEFYVKDVEILRYFFDGVDVGVFGLLHRVDFVDFVMLTLGEDLGMSCRDVERLTFPDAGRSFPRLINFAEFSRFYLALAAKELAKHGGNFTPRKPKLKRPSKRESAVGGGEKPPSTTTRAASLSRLSSRPPLPMTTSLHFSQRRNVWFEPSAAARQFSRRAFSRQPRLTPIKSEREGGGEGTQGLPRSSSAPNIGDPAPSPPFAREEATPLLPPPRGGVPLRLERIRSSAGVCLQPRERAESREMSKPYKFHWTT